MKKEKRLILAIALIFIGILVITVGGYVTYQYYSTKTDNQPQIEDIEEAKNTLIKYFYLLNSKKYNDAVIYNGYGYDNLIYYNPDISPTDYSNLLKRGCEQNGYICLKIGNILDKRQISPSEFIFKVQFLNNNGTLFHAAFPNRPQETDFDYIVQKVSGGFLVMKGPIYQE